MYTPDIIIKAEPINIERLGISPNTKTLKISRKTMREYLNGIIADNSPARSDDTRKR